MRELPALGAYGAGPLGLRACASRSHGRSGRGLGCLPGS